MKPYNLLNLLDLRAGAMKFEKITKVWLVQMFKTLNKGVYSDKIHICQEQ